MSVAGRARVKGARARIWHRGEGTPGPDGSPATSWTALGYAWLLCETATAEVAQQVFGADAAVTLRAAGGASAPRASLRDGIEITAGAFAGRYVVEGVIAPPGGGPRAHVEYGLRRLRSDEESGFPTPPPPAPAP